MGSVPGAARVVMRVGDFGRAKELEALLEEVGR
jgi:hypothetical protein